MAQPTKAFFLIEGNRGRIDCHFNPATLALTKNASWGSTGAAGTNAPKLKFARGGSATLDMQLTFDTTRTGEDVTAYTSKLLNLMKIDPDLPGYDTRRGSGRPPWVQFCWGSLNSFKGVVQTLTVTFTYFAASGRPLRAKTNVKLHQLEDDQPTLLQNPTSHTPTLHAVHMVRQGETLDRIAATRYQDPGKWRLIAEANGVLDPLNVPAGTVLVVPEQPVRRRGQ